MRKREEKNWILYLRQESLNVGLGPNALAAWCSHKSVEHDAHGRCNGWLLFDTTAHCPAIDPGNVGLFRSRGGPKYLALCCFQKREKRKKKKTCWIRNACQGNVTMAHRNKNNMWTFHFAIMIFLFHSVHHLKEPNVYYFLFCCQAFSTNSVQFYVQRTQKEPKQNKKDAAKNTKRSSSQKCILKIEFKKRNKKKVQNTKNNEIIACSMWMVNIKQNIQNIWMQFFHSQTIVWVRKNRISVSFPSICILINVMTTLDLNSIQNIRIGCKINDEM